MTTSVDRKGAGKSDKSWQKHEVVGPAVLARTAIMASMRGRYLIVDLTAGDGDGVPSDQMSIDGLRDVSRATARLAIEAGIKSKRRADVILCESDSGKRARLAQVVERFRDRVAIEVLDDYQRLVERLHPGWYENAIAINDVCGPSQHPMGVLAHVVRCVPKADLLLVSNERFFYRYYDGSLAERLRAGDPSVPQGHRTIWERYGWQYLGPPHSCSNYQEWMRRLGKKRCMYFARTVVGSDNFAGRVMLYTNFLEPRHIPAGWLACRL